MATSDTPMVFGSLPEEKFPVQIYAFSPEQEFLWHVEVNPYESTPFPGFGPGSTRYMLWVFADGTAQLLDDPTCGDTV